MTLIIERLQCFLGVVERISSTSDSVRPRWLSHAHVKEANGCGQYFVFVLSRIPYIFKGGRNDLCVLSHTISFGAPAFILCTFFTFYEKRYHTCSRSHLWTRRPRTRLSNPCLWNFLSFGYANSPTNAKSMELYWHAVIFCFARVPFCGKFSY